MISPSPLYLPPGAIYSGGVTSPLFVQGDVPGRTFLSDSAAGQDVPDATGSNVTGIRNSTISWINGPMGPALQATGTAGSCGYVDYGTSETFDFTTGPFSVLFWCVPPATAVNWLPVGRSTGSNGWYVYFASTSGAIDFNVGGTSAYANSTWSVGVMAHYAFVRLTSTTALIYKNGSPVSMTASTVANASGYSGGHLFQNHYTSGSYSQACTLWGLKIFGHVLSANDVASEWADSLSNHLNPSHF